MRSMAKKKGQPAENLSEPKQGPLTRPRGPPKSEGPKEGKKLMSQQGRSYPHFQDSLLLSFFLQHLLVVRALCELTRLQPWPW
jgi:hypothetical protein